MLRTLRTPLLIAGLLALPFAVIACGDDDDDTEPTTGSTQPPAATATTAAPTQAAASPTTSAAEPEVTVVDNAFQPASLTVEAGTEVTWTWSGALPHSVVGTFAGEEVESETLTGSGTFAFTFDEPGEFAYICGIHGADMAGRVIVE